MRARIKGWHATGDEPTRRLAGDLRDQRGKGVERKTRLDEALRDVRSLNLTVARLQRQLASARSGGTGPGAALGADGGAEARQAQLAEEIESLKAQNAQLRLEAGGSIDSYAAQVLIETCAGQGGRTGRAGGGWERGAKCPGAQRQARRSLEQLGEVQEAELQALRGELTAAKAEIGRMAIGSRATEEDAPPDMGDPFRVWELLDDGANAAGAHRLRDPVSNVLFTDERNVWKWPQVLGRPDAAGNVGASMSRVAGFMQALDRLFSHGGRRVECAARSSRRRPLPARCGLRRAPKGLWRICMCKGSPRAWTAAAGLCSTNTPARRAC